MYSKLSKIMARIMLVIFCTLLALAVIAKASDFHHKSYVVELACAFLLVFGLFKVKDLVYEFVCRIAKTKICLALSIVCAVVRFCWVLYCRITPYSDYKMFFDVANAIVSGERSIHYIYISLFPHIYGYSSFLAVFIRMFGSNVFVATFLNVILSTLTGTLLFKISENYVGIKSAVIVFLFWIFMPSIVFMNAHVLSEPSYTFLLTLFFYILTKYNNKLSYMQLLLFTLIEAVLLIAINAMRPIGAIIIIALVIWVVVLKNRDNLSIKECFVSLTLVITLVGVFTLGNNLWSNIIESKIGIKPSGFPAYNVCVGLNESTMGTYADDDMQEFCYHRYREGYTPDECQQFMLDKAVERIKLGNINYPKLFLSKLAEFIGHDEIGAHSMPRESLGSWRPLAVFVSNIFHYALILMALSGAKNLMKECENRIILIAPLYTIGLTMAHLIIEVSNRYHYSTVPMLMLIAAFALKEKSNPDGVSCKMHEKLL